MQLNIGDARRVMEALPDESIHAVVTDPPYGLSQAPDIAEVLTHWLAGDDYFHKGGGFMGKCLHPDTDLLTRQGWKPVALVTEDDEVCSINPDTGRIEYVGVTALHTYDFEGDLLSVGGRSARQVVTPNHRVWTDRGLVQADQLPSNFRIYNQGVWRGRHDDVLEIEGAEFDAVALLRFYGLWLGDGYVAHRINQPWKQDFIGFTVIKSETVCAIRDACAALGVRFTETLGSDGRTAFYIYNKHLLEWLSPIRGAHNKAIFPWVFELSSGLLDHLYEGLIDTDGTRQGVNGQQVYYTVSDVLADDFQRLCLHTGRSAVKTWRDRPTNFGDGRGWVLSVLQSRDGFWMERDGRRGRPQPSAVQHVPYEGKVHCVTLERHHVMLSRFDGRTVWTGNSWDSFVPGPATWREAFRVLKPGGHILVFAGTRTMDLMGMAIRLAGFEIRDTLTWLYGAGFPKSMSVHKATQKAVDSRYGSARCSCLDARAGVVAGPDAGRRGGAQDRSIGDGGISAQETVGDSDVQIDQSADLGAMRELREDDSAQAKGHSSVSSAVLQPGVRERGTEASGQRGTEVRTGVEETPNGDSQEGPSVSGVRMGTGETVGATRSSPQAVSVRGDEPADESGGPVRELPSQDRSGDGPSAGVDPDRRKPRELHPDNFDGGGAAVAIVCSWCGLPDGDWLTSLEPFGTALKPSYEPIIMARKPMTKPSAKTGKPVKATVAETVLEHGTGAINIDGTRIGYQSEDDQASAFPQGRVTTHGAGSLAGPSDAQDVDRNEIQAQQGSGRWPANTILTHHEDCVQVGTRKVRTGTAVQRHGGGQAIFGGIADGENTVGSRDDATFADDDGTETITAWDCHESCPVRLLDEQTGTLTSGNAVVGTGRGHGSEDAQTYSGGSSVGGTIASVYADSGGASRFFYSSKTSKKERNAGLDQQPDRVADPYGQHRGRRMQDNDDRFDGKPASVGKNDHPTVKPIAVMEWLTRLVTPPGGTVLDPFMGSGTTGIACANEGFDFIGIDQDDHYVNDISYHRIVHHGGEPEVTDWRETFAVCDLLLLAFTNWPSSGDPAIPAISEPVEPEPEPTLDEPERTEPSEPEEIIEKSEPEPEPKPELDESLSTEDQLRAILERQRRKAAEDNFESEPESVSEPTPTPDPEPESKPAPVMRDFG